MTEVFRLVEEIDFEKWEFIKANAFLWLRGPNIWRQDGNESKSYSRLPGTFGTPKLFERV